MHGKKTTLEKFIQTTICSLSFHLTFLLRLWLSPLCQLSLSSSATTCKNTSLLVPVSVAPHLGALLSSLFLTLVPSPLFFHTIFASRCLKGLRLVIRPDQCFWGLEYGSTGSSFNGQTSLQPSRKWISGSRISWCSILVFYFCVTNHHTFNV